MSRGRGPVAAAREPIPRLLRHGGPAVGQTAHLGSAEGMVLTLTQTSVQGMVSTPERLGHARLSRTGNNTSVRRTLPLKDEAM